jgi:hypothetical protein
VRLCILKLFVILSAKCLGNFFIILMISDVFAVVLALLLSLSMNKVKAQSTL